MKRARQNTLQVRPRAMIRALPGAAVAVLAFSLVFFSPLLDVKDTIAANAQGNGNNGNGNNGNNGNGNQGGGGNQGQSGSAGGGGGNSSGNSSSSGNSGNASNNGSSQGGGNAGSSAGGQGGNNGSRGRPAASGGPASQTPASGNFLKRIFGGSPFTGDSEPSGNPLTQREEREAIRNGWK